MQIALLEFQKALRNSIYAFDLSNPDVWSRLFEQLIAAISHSNTDSIFDTNETNRTQ